MDRLVEVIVGMDGIEIRYNDKTNDQRNENAGKWRTTVDMLEQIVAAMDAENTEEKAQHDEMTERQRARVLAKISAAEVSAEKTSTFGNNKAYREAKALADSK